MRHDGGMEVDAYVSGTWVRAYISNMMDLVQDSRDPADHGNALGVCGV
jgi:hypothetical protein